MPQDKNHWNQAFGNAIDTSPSEMDAHRQRAEQALKLDEWKKDQVTAQPLPEDRPTQKTPAFIPEALPLETITPTRAPDSWVIDQSGQRLPTWSTADDIKPKWKSKIFITQSVMFAFAVLSMIFGIDVSLEMQHMVLNAILAVMGGGSFLTIIFRLFFTKKKLV